MSLHLPRVQTSTTLALPPQCEERQVHHPEAGKVVIELVVFT